MIFLDGVGCVTSNSWLDFGGDSDHDADLGIFAGIFPLRDRDNAESVLLMVRLAASAEV